MIEETLFFGERNVKVSLPDRTRLVADSLMVSYLMGG